MAWDNAEAVASELLALVQAASPHIRAQWAWAGVCNLIKMTSVKREAFPISLQASTCARVRERLFATPPPPASARLALRMRTARLCARPNAKNYSTHKCTCTHTRARRRCRGLCRRR